MVTILIPIPSKDFDPTEVAIPWQKFKAKGHTVVFATPDGKRGYADEKMVTGKGLGILAPMLMATKAARDAYKKLETNPNFLSPITYDQINPDDYQVLILPGGHAQGMKPYLESEILKRIVKDFFQKNKIVGAICHGVVLAARAGVLKARKTTALAKWMELNAWASTALWLGNYYRTYPETVQSEVTRALTNKSDFIIGPYSLSRERNFTVIDGNYISAGWPGDAEGFADAVNTILEQNPLH